MSLTPQHGHLGVGSVLGDQAQIVITTTASHTDVREATLPVESEQQKPRNQRGDCGKPHKGQLSVAWVNGGITVAPNNPRSTDTYDEKPTRAPLPAITHRLFGPRTTGG